MRKFVQLALGLVGLFVSLYLWWAYTTPSRPMVCMGTGCDIVRASAYAKLWGHPLPVYGAAMFGALVALMFAEATFAGRGARWARLPQAVVSGAGFLFSLYLSGIEEFVLHAWCAWCVVSAISVTLFFALAVLELVRPSTPAESGPLLVRMKPYLLLSAAGLLLGAPTFYALARRTELPPSKVASPEVLAERLVRAESHAAGNPQAGLTVVEYADFQCPYCAAAEKTAREIRKRYANEIRFVFRQFPMPYHEYARKAAEASECAAEQGKFWEAVEKLYERQADLTEPALVRYAGELGLDTKRFRTCLESGAMAWRVQHDAEDGHAVGVSRTPTFFIGERKIEGGMEFDQFAQSIERELARRAANPAGENSPQAPERVAQAGSKFFTQFQSPTAACSEDEGSGAQPPLIRTAEARVLFDGNPKALFVDVRPAREFGRTRIRGAINLPADEFERVWNRLPKDRDIVLYESGRSGPASLDACAASRAAGRVLLARGFSPQRVKVFQDGLAAWEKAGLPVELSPK